MSDWIKTFMALMSMAVLAFTARIFKVDFQLMLLCSIAYDLIYMRIDKDNE